MTVDHPGWIDSHCHLEMLDADIGLVLDQAVSQGVASCITIGTDARSNVKVLEYCQMSERVFGTLGVHPHNASSLKDADLDWIRKNAAIHPRIVGIGECGFDFYYHRSSIEDQRRAFVAQLEIARELGLPVVIHARDADAATRDVLNDYRKEPITGVIHCFTSSIAQARYVLDLGLYISFNGICTFPLADAIRKLVRFVPADRMLLETDAPFLSPVPFRGKPNVPAHVAIVGTYLAQWLKMDIESLAEQTRANTWRLFRKRMGFP
jgi:TatD DNase family protein